MSHAIYRIDEIQQRDDAPAIQVKTFVAAFGTQAKAQSYIDLVLIPADWLASKTARTGDLTTAEEFAALAATMQGGYVIESVADAATAIPTVGIFWHVGASLSLDGVRVIDVQPISKAESLEGFVAGQAEAGSNNEYITIIDAASADDAAQLAVVTLDLIFKQRLEALLASREG